MAARGDAGPPMKTPYRAVLLITVALAVPIVPFAVIGELPGEQWLDAAGGDALAFGAAAGGLLAADALIPVPSTIVGTLLGARLGFVPGWLWAWAGLVLGNAVGYGIGRAVLRRLGAELPQTPTAIALILSRPVPVVAEAMTFAAGAGGLGWWPFLAASVAANGVFAGALAANGAALLPNALVGPGLVLPMALPVAGWLAWRWHRRRSSAISRNLSERDQKPCST